jgi:nucleoside-diphosphate-sugar epimerase
VAERTALKTGKKVPIKHIDPPTPLHPIEFRNFIADTQRFFKATGFKTKYSLIEGIDRTIRSFDNS